MYSVYRGDIENNAVVVFDQKEVGTYAGVISGTGIVIKTNEGILALTGKNTYSGGTIVSKGILQGDTTSLQGDIRNSASVVFNQKQKGTYAGIISGSGTLNKMSNGTLIFTKDSSAFTGNVAINAGALIVDGALGGTMTVWPGAKLGGKGAVGTVVNNGRIEPGSSIGTLTVNGNYTQGPSGILNIEINEAGATDLFHILGTATLNGTLHISPEPGVYLEGTTYTFLTARTVTGRFSSSFSDFPLNYKINYFSDRAQLFILDSSLILPPRPSGNAGQ